jgi:hypothetical protein
MSVANLLSEKIWEALWQIVIGFLLLLTSHTLIYGFAKGWLKALENSVPGTIEKTVT